MTAALIDVALIVKNEQEHLPECLAAIKALGSLVGSICVYDTGSTDDTVAIATAAGAILELGYWDKDFARARNAAIDMCTGKWVLILDADERIVANPKALGPYLRRAQSEGMTGYDAIDVAVINVLNGTSGEAWLSRRLFRRGRAHYVGAVHEQVFPVREGGSLTALDPGPSMIAIEHHGYSSMERVVAKTARNEELAQREIDRMSVDAEDPEALIRALVDRARSMLVRGEIAEAVEDLQRVRAMQSRYTYRWWGMEQLADILISAGRLDEARDVVEHLAREGSGQAYRDWLTARRLMALGDIEGGMAILRRLDVLYSACGFVVKPSLLQAARLKGAIALGEFDEALACVIALMGAGQVAGYCGLLLRLWGQRPLPVLAELLGDSAGDHLDAIADEADRHGLPGQRLGRQLRGGAVAGMPRAMKPRPA
ncbi:MAG TPA: glycosyltransferase family 2 protein [Dermatophilaceae bacterium]|nr:glycosyltransferase family 2 protein [Dermatophilaceae bacterium]